MPKTKLKDFDPSHLDPNRVFFTSDTHFFHKWTITDCKRPFTNIKEMNTALIQRWNNKVPRDGVVFHLGDFCYGSEPQFEFLRRNLNGRIVLVLGNHDLEQFVSHPEMFQRLFDIVEYQMVIKVRNQQIWLNHYPYLEWGEGDDDASWQLFGHVHTSPYSNEGADKARLVHLNPRQYDVGVDNNDFAPVSFMEVNGIINRQINNH